MFATLAQTKGKERRLPACGSRASSSRGPPPETGCGQDVRNPQAGSLRSEVLPRRSEVLLGILKRGILDARAVFSVFSINECPATFDETD